MAVINVTRAVKHTSDETLLRRDVEKLIYKLEPDSAPLFLLTTKAQRRQPAIQPKYEWGEDAEVPLWGQCDNGTSDYASNATGILVKDGTIFAVGDLILIPVATGAGKSAAEEVALVTAVNTNTLTLTRNIGGAGADTITGTSPLRIIGQACVEGGDVPAVRSTQKVAKASYCQYFRTPVATTEIMEATESFGVPEGERNYQKGEALVRHKSEIEAAGLWGRGSETLAAAGSRWTTQGFKPTISTNIKDFSTTITYTSMLSFAESVFRYGERKKLTIAGPSIMSAMDYMSANKVTTNVEDDSFGVNITKIVTNNGTFMLARHFRMEAGVAGAAGFNDEMYVINLPSVKLRYLAGNGKNLDTKFYSDEVRDGKTRTVDEWRSMVGWQVMEEKKHGRAYNGTAFA